MIYSLSYYIPEKDHERVKKALLASGAGNIGHYDQCAWEVLGQGQFRAQKGSQAHIGELDQLETILEYKVEMVCKELYIKAVIQTLLKEHPYEQPAYFVQPVMTLDDFV